MAVKSDGPLESRYGTAHPAPLVEWNDVLEQLVSHRSVRSFMEKPLPAGTLESLVAAAQSASTSSNLQVWSVVAVQDSGRKRRLSELAGNQSCILEAPLFLVWLADLARAAQVAEQSGVVLEALPYLEGLLLGTIDVALAAQNAVVALESLGLGCVYIGGIRNDIEAVASELALPPQVYPVFGMCIGYPRPDNPGRIKPRLPQSMVVHHEQYSNSLNLETLAQYDNTLYQFYVDEGMKAAHWSEHVVNRLRNSTCLHGRQFLAEKLRRAGFGLR